MGWVGRKDQLRTYLQVVNADRDEDGAYIIEPADALCVGLDGDVVVSDGAYYLSGGDKKMLAAGLGSTSYGMQIKVF